MPTFQITGPDGKKYRVTGENPAGAMQALRKMVDKPSSGLENVPEFAPPGVEGYDPKTGEVTRPIGKGESALTGAADAATFGFGDEIAGGLISALGGSDYEKVRDQIRGTQASAQEQNPKSYLGGQVGGAVAQGVGAKGLSLMAQAPSLLGRVARGMGIGGAMSGAHGVGSGTDAGSRALGGVTEGAIGTLTGGAFPLLAKGASSAYSALADALIGRQGGNAAGMTPEALRMLGTAFDADGTRGAVGASNIAAAGPEAMLADAGPNARAILDTAIQRGGPGTVAAQTAISDRTGRAAQSITGALDNALGQPQGVTATRTAIRKGSASARSAAYEKAYAAPIDYASQTGQTIERMVKTRVPKGAIDAANELMRTMDEQSKQILAKVDDAGNVVFETLPDIRQLDYITRGLNEVADAADGAGKLGGTTARGKAYRDLATDLRRQMKQAVPEYGEALETAADPISRSKAVELGSKMFSPSMTRDQWDEAVQGMTGPEKTALAQGIRSRFDDAMANVTRTIQDGDVPAREAIKAIKDMSSRANREKLTAAIGKDKADALFDEMDRASKSFDLRASVADNSKTYARQSVDRRIGEITQPGTIAELASGKPLNAMQRLAQVLTGNTPANRAGRQDAIYSELAEALTRPSGQGQVIFDALTDMGNKGQAAQLMNQRIARLLAQPQLSYPIGMQGQDIGRNR